MSERTPEIIRDLREKHEYKQEIIAKYLGVVQQTYSNYEKGHTSLPLDYLVKLAKFYGVSADYLLGLTSFQKPFSEAYIGRLVRYLTSCCTQEWGL